MFLSYVVHNLFLRARALKELGNEETNASKELLFFLLRTTYHIFLYALAIRTLKVKHKAIFKQYGEF